MGFSIQRIVDLTQGVALLLFIVLNSGQQLSNLSGDAGLGVKVERYDRRGVIFLYHFYPTFFPTDFYSFSLLIPAIFSRFHPVYTPSTILFHLFYKRLYLLQYKGFKILAYNFLRIRDIATGAYEYSDQGLLY